MWRRRITANLSPKPPACDRTKSECYQEEPKKLKETCALVNRRGGPPSKAEKGRGSVVVRRDEGFLEAISREKSGRDTGFLVYDSQQEIGLTFLEIMTYGCEYCN
jgi:hypothetical protein